MEDVREKDEHGAAEAHGHRQHHPESPAVPGQQAGRRAPLGSRGRRPARACPRPRSVGSTEACRTRRTRSSSRRESSPPGAREGRTARSASPRRARQAAASGMSRTARKTICTGIHSWSGGTASRSISTSPDRRRGKGADRARTTAKVADAEAHRHSTPSAATPTAPAAEPTPMSERARQGRPDEQPQPDRQRLAAVRRTGSRAGATQRRQQKREQSAHHLPIANPTARCTAHERDEDDPIADAARRRRPAGRDPEDS